MSKRLRTFVALRCGRAVAARLRRESERLAALEGAFRAPRTDDYHLTVQFLGDTAEEDLPALGRALEAAAASTAPLEVVYGGLGAFPSAQRARVVWVGMQAPQRPEALADLAGAVGQALEPLGYPPEARAFHPHITLGRLRRRPGPALVSAVEEGERLALGHETLSDLKLILSDPGDRGYRYIDLTTVELGSPGRT
jgi:2'-5' RNA ligase